MVLLIGFGMLSFVVIVKLIVDAYVHTRSPVVRQYVRFMEDGSDGIMLICGDIEVRWRGGEDTPTVVSPDGAKEICSITKRGDYADVRINRGNLNQSFIGWRWRQPTSTAAAK
jgi:hypothetical protein